MSAKELLFPTDPHWATIQKYRDLQDSMENTLFPELVDFYLAVEPLFKTEEEQKTFMRLRGKILLHINTMKRLKKDFDKEMQQDTQEDRSDR